MSVMGIEMKGFDDIGSTLNSLGKVEDKITTTALRNSMKDGLEIIKGKAPKASKGSTNSAEHLKVGKIKRYKSGSVWGGMGIDSSNWENTKGLYFQHWGYEHWKSGKRVQPHVGWFDEALLASEETILGSLEDKLLSEIDKILK